MQLLLQSSNRVCFHYIFVDIDSKHQILCTHMLFDVISVIGQIYNKSLHVYFLFLFFK